jgi:hypothetical protein
VHGRLGTRALWPAGFPRVSFLQGTGLGQRTVHKTSPHGRPRWVLGLDTVTQLSVSGQLLKIITCSAQWQAVALGSFPASHAHRLLGETPPLVPPPALAMRGQQPKRLTWHRRGTSEGRCLTRAVTSSRHFAWPSSVPFLIYVSP